MTDALAKLLIANGIITDKEFKAQLGEEVLTSSFSLLIFTAHNHW